MQLTSDAFTDGADIPAKYTCDGENVAPPLAWSGVPSGTAELVLFVDDPDAPGGRFVHWVVTGIRPSATSPAQGKAVVAYRGPCPPGGSKDDPHHYEFRIYALRNPTSLAVRSATAVRKGLAAAHPLAVGLLVGRYGR